MGLFTQGFSVFSLVWIKDENWYHKFLSRVGKYIFIKTKTPVTKDLKAVDTNVLS